MISCFDRPTRLDTDGLAGWVRMFGGAFLDRLAPAERAVLPDRVARLAEPGLLREGTWYADYRRLRVLAQR